MYVLPKDSQNITIARYAVCGPMEVIHLNAEGLKKYCEVYGDTIYNVSTDFKGIPDAWKMDTADGVAEVFIKNRVFKM